MRVPTFIGLASLLITMWLGVAFFRDVPTGNYPVIDGALVTKPASTSHKTLAATIEDLPFEP